MASDKRRERIEKEQELQTQEHVIASARAAIAQSEKRLAQIDRRLPPPAHAERNEIAAARRTSWRRSAPSRRTGRGCWN